MNVPPDDEGNDRAPEEFDPFDDAAGLSIISIVELRESSPSLPNTTLITPRVAPQTGRSTNRGYGVPERPAETSTAASLLAIGRPETPTLVDRLQTTIEPGPARAQRLERGRASANDPQRAALFAYELADLAERSGDLATAEKQYRDALSCEPDLRAASWGLRRVLYGQARWHDCIDAIDAELHQVDPDAYRAELLLEKAHLENALGDRTRGRALLEAAERIAPGHEGVLFALHRELTACRDADATAALLPRIARLQPTPERAAGYFLEATRLALARHDVDLARAACAEAERLAATVSLGMRTAIARARVRVADVSPLDHELVDSLEALIGVRGLAPSSELGPLLRRQARIVRATDPARAWDLLQSAVEQLPNESILIAELLELAVQLGLFKELIPLVGSWRSIEGDAGRRDQISIWSAASHLGHESQFAARTLLAAVASATPGFIHITTATESRALVDATRDPSELAAAYLAAARATALGTWVGPGLEPIPDARAAAAWNLTAAEILAFQIGSPTALAQAREALRQAEHQLPGDPIVTEAQIELDESHGRPQAAIARLLQPTASVAELERAATIAATHDMFDDLLQVERRLADDEPRNLLRLWRYEATLARLGRHADRKTVLQQLAELESEPERKSVALYHALALALRTHDVAAATAVAATLAELVPADDGVRDVHLELLRSTESWDELTAVLGAEVARPFTDGVIARRMRELAWLHEVRHNNPTGAAEVYTRWLAAIPHDRTALEGLARCAATLRDPQREAQARQQIAELDGSPDAEWLLARANERAGRSEAALQRYRHVLELPGWSVALANAALAAGDLAASAGDLNARVEATAALAAHTTDEALASALHESVGWCRLFGLFDGRGASSAFSAAASASSRFGLVLATLGDHAGRAAALQDLAMVVDRDSAAALLARASVHAHTACEHDRASALLEAAFAAADEDDDHALVRLADEPLSDATLADPFATDQCVARANVLGRRAELALPAARATWQLERAEMLEHAGELAAASDVVAEILDADPANRAALEALRRLSQRAGDQAREAQVSYVLAGIYRDTHTKLSLLRRAARVFDGAGRQSHVGYSITIYRQIAVLDPVAPELERVLELLRQASSQVGLFVVLGEQIDALAVSRGNDSRLVALLLQRSELLERLDRKKEAVRDLETAMAYAVDTTTVRGRLAALGVRPRTAPVPTVTAVPERHARARGYEVTTTGGMGADSEITDAEPLSMLTPPPQIARVADIDASAASDDPFSATTVQADLAEVAKFDEAGFTDTSPGNITATEPVRLDPEMSVGPTVADTPSKLRRLASPVDITEARRPQRIEVDGPWIEMEPTVERRTLPDVAGDFEPVSDESAAVMIPVHALQPVRTSGEREQLLALERELAIDGDEARTASLRYDLGRTALTSGDPDRARRHFELALDVPAHTGHAARQLRVLALRRGDAREAARLCAAERKVAGPAEQEPLARLHADLLLVAGDHEQAGAALPPEPAGLARALAGLDLAVAARDTSAINARLDAIMPLVPPEVAESLRFARGAVALQRRDMNEADRWFVLSSVSSVSLMRLEAIRHTALQGEGELAGAALLELAYHVEREDQITAAALALRAQSWMGGTKTGAIKETISAAGELAMRAMPRDALVCRIVSERALATEADEAASHAYARWLRAGSHPAERAYAAGRAAELSPARLGRLWAQLLELDGPDDYAAARLHRVLTESGDHDAVIEHDLTTAASAGRIAPLLRAAATLETHGNLDRAIDLLENADQSSPLVREILANTLEAAGRHEARARVLSEGAASAGELGALVLRTHAADAWSTVAHASDEDSAREVAFKAGFDAWAAVLAHDPTSPRAHALSIQFASEIGDVALYGRALSRARAVAATQAASTTLALQHARMLVAREPKLAVSVARTAMRSADDPRGTALTLFLAARQNEWTTVSAALEDRIDVLVANGRESLVECTQLRMRAIQLYLDRGDRERARPYVEAVHASFPGAGLVDDLLPLVGAPAIDPLDASTPSLVRLVHAGERASLAGDLQRALDLYWRALLAHRSPLAAEPFMRIARQIGFHGQLRAYAENQIAATMELRDAGLFADVLDAHASACSEPFGDESARGTLEQLLLLDETRSDVAIRLEQSCVASARLDRALQLRQLPYDHAAAEIADTVALALACGANLRDLTDVIRSAAAEPSCSLFVLRFADALSADAAPDALAALTQRIASRIEQPRSQAALLSRAATVLAGSGDHEGAIVQANAALAAWPDYLPILDTIRRSAVAASAWDELVRAAQREAASSNGDAEHLHHLAAVAAMDKLGDRSIALPSLRATLEGDPRNTDALLRLRLMCVNTPMHGLVIDAVQAALHEKPSQAVVVELRRILAELERAAGRTDRANTEYQRILSLAPGDRRIHAALFDLQAETAGEERRDAIEARLHVERDTLVLCSLHWRRAALLAPRDPAAAVSSLRSALENRADDERALTMLVDLAANAGDLTNAGTAWDRLADRAQSSLPITAPIAGIAQRAVYLARAAPTTTRMWSRLERIARLARDRVDSDVYDVDASSALAIASAGQAERPGAPASHRRIAYFARELVAIGGARPEDMPDPAEAAAGGAMLADPALDRALLAGTSERGLCLLLREAADPITRVFATDVARYGATKRDRLRANHPIATIARELARPLGFDDVAVYVTPRHSHAMIVEPFPRLTLVLGHEIARGQPAIIRFAAGAGLKLAQLGLAAPARLPIGELAVLAAALVRLSRPDANLCVDAAAVVARAESLLLHSPALPERLAASPLAVDPIELARDLKLIGLKAGVVASGTLHGTLTVLADAIPAQTRDVLADPTVRRLIGFSLSELAPLRW